MLPAQTAQPLEIEVPQSGGDVDVAVRPVLTPERGRPAAGDTLRLGLPGQPPTPAPTSGPTRRLPSRRTRDPRGSPVCAAADLRSLESDDWDERVADLQYRDVCEYAVGHGVATERCQRRRPAGPCTRAGSQAEVERVAPAEIDGVELWMEALASCRRGRRPRS